MGRQVRQTFACGDLRFVCSLAMPRNGTENTEQLYLLKLNPLASLFTFLVSPSRASFKGRIHLSVVGRLR